MGNPSDGFYGKTIALSIANFWAEVTIVESPKLVRHCCVVCFLPILSWPPAFIIVYCTVVYYSLLGYTVVYCTVVY